LLSVAKIDSVENEMIIIDYHTYIFLTWSLHVVLVCPDRPSLSTFFPSALKRSNFCPYVAHVHAIAPLISPALLVMYLLLDFV
jgi:hypothetical protein